MIENNADRHDENKEDILSNDRNTDTVRAAGGSPEPAAEPINETHAESVHDKKDFSKTEYHSTERMRESVYSPSESGYSFHGNASPHGTGYTTPDGGHGYAYAPASGNGKMSRGSRRALIIAAVIASLLLLAGCCFLGAWAAAKAFPTNDGGGGEGEGTEYQYELGTSNGLTIMDGTVSLTDSGGNLLTPGNNQAIETGATAPYDPHPHVPNEASIAKLNAERTDADGDGKADFVYGADGEVLTSAGADRYSTATVVSLVADSVVEISTETLVQSGRIGQYVTGGAGSGVIIAKEGFIVTNNHVIDGADSITVRLTDGTSYPATLVGTDEKTDIAVSWIDAGDKTLTVATLGSSYDLVVGEDVIAIGNPLGSLGGTVTEGIISATAREITVDSTNMTLLQVSAPINPGNSGGGLFNQAGELIGVVNAKMSSEEIEGLGFAIPVDTAYEIICEIIEFGYVRGRPYLGLTLVDVTDQYTALRYFNSRYTGVYIYDSLASGEFEYGDLIVSINGEAVSSTDDVEAMIGQCEVGDVLEVIVWRDGKKVTVEHALQEYVPDYLGTDD